MEAERAPAHFEPEFYQDLPSRILDKVCTCGSKEGWSRDFVTDWWVCAACHLPSIYNGVRICEGCEKKFVPFVNPGTQPTDWADSCYDCFPEQPSSPLVYRRQAFASEPR